MAAIPSSPGAVTVVFGQACLLMWFHYAQVKDLGFRSTMCKFGLSPVFKKEMTEFQQESFGVCQEHQQKHCSAYVSHRTKGLTRNVKLFVLENKEWLAFQEHAWKSTLHVYESSHAYLFKSKLWSPFGGFSLSRTLWFFVVIVLKANESQKNTQCWSHSAGSVITGTAKDREQILQPDLSLSEEQQCLGIKLKVIHDSKKSNLSSVSLAQIEMKWGRGLLRSLCNRKNSLSNYTQRKTLHNCICL